MRERVEDAARPILIPLFKGNQIRLTADDQKKVATWATLKAMVAEWTIAGFAGIHHTQRKRMMKIQEPPEHGWAFWIGRFVSGLKPNQKKFETAWASHPILVRNDHHASARPNQRAAHFNSHISTQVIGELFIHIIRCKVPSVIHRWNFSPPDCGTLFRIWPRTDVSIAWPATALSDADAAYTAVAFLDFIRKIQKAKLDDIERAGFN